MSGDLSGEQKVATVRTVLLETFNHRAATFKERPNGTNYLELQAAMLSHQAAYNPGFNEKAIHLYDNVGVGRWTTELADEMLAALEETSRPPAQLATTTVKRNPK